jgi:hypothetical protein
MIHPEINPKLIFSCESCLLLRIIPNPLSPSQDGGINSENDEQVAQMRHLLIVFGYFPSRFWGGAGVGLILR